MKKVGKLLVITLVLLTLCSCKQEVQETPKQKTYKVGICNWVADTSLNQIEAHIISQLKSYENEEVKFEIIDKNAQADMGICQQIISDFTIEGVDLMVAIATPVASLMKASIADNNIPVVFAAVSDPVGAGLVAQLDNPQDKISGTSDALDVDGLFDIMFTIDPNIETVGLLYDLSQDSSASAIENAKTYLTNKGIVYTVKNGSNLTEILQASDALIGEKVNTIFTPSDNTIMTAENSIYEKFITNGIKHYGGADSFATDGAFIGYGVDYAVLGDDTGDMVADILLNGKDISSYPVKVCQGGIITINTDVAVALGVDIAELINKLQPLNCEIKQVTTGTVLE